MLTPRGAKVATGSTLLALISWIIGEPMFVLLSSLLLVILILNMLWFKRSEGVLDHFSCSRAINSNTVFAENEVDVVLTLKNLSNRASSLISVTDDIPETIESIPMRHDMVRVGGLSELSLSSTITPREPGSFHFRSVRLLAFDPFMLFWSEKIVECKSSLRVYPKLGESFAYAKASRSSHSLMSFRRATISQGSGTEFYEIRDYNPGDDFRTISWKSMARSPTFQPMTKQMEQEKTLSVLIVIHNTITMADGEYGSTKIAKALESALALSSIIIREGDEVGFVYVGEEGHARFSECVGRDRFIEAAQILHSLEPIGRTELSTLLAFVQRLARKQAHIIVISDTTSVDKAQINWLRRLSAFGQDIRVVLFDTSRFAKLPEGTDDFIVRASKMLRTKEDATTDDAMKFARERGLDVAVCGPEDCGIVVIDGYLSARKKWLR